MKAGCKSRRFSESWIMVVWFQCIFHMLLLSFSSQCYDLACVVRSLLVLNGNDGWIPPWSS